MVYPYFHGELEILYSKNDFEDFYNSQKISIMNKIQSYVSRAPIQKFIGMEFIDIYFYRVKLLNGSSCITPLFNNNNNNNIVNIQNFRRVLAVIGLRKVIANNKCISDYAKEKLSNFMLYLDANNLYGWAMSQKLPTGNFKWQYN